MSNECLFSIRVKGSKHGLIELYKIMALKHPNKLGFFRLYEINTSKSHKKHNDGYVSASISGVCVHSVYSCMLEGENTYYNSYIANEEFTEDFKGTNILIASKRLNLEIEIYSTVYGDNFEEHYYIKNGKLLIERVENFELYYDEYNEEHGDGPSMYRTYQF